MSKRRLWSIEGNRQRLDGGAMFGNAPKAVWQRWIAADERNTIPLACRALLVEEVSTRRRILFEAGIGLFFPPHLRARFGVTEDRHMLIENLAAAGFTPADVDVIVLSHLHFDHAGGLLTPWAEGEEPALVFPHCEYVVSAGAWERALTPHARDRASFIPELQGLLEGTGRLEVVAGETSRVLGPEYRLHRSEGHTPGLMLTEIPGADGPIVYCGDLIPGAPWVHLPITMGYDRYPERLIDEKTALLSDLVGRSGRVFFTHDPHVALATVALDPRGRFKAAGSLEKLDALIA
jgi:glyoxylase-like metal-dependent hydrolase (beta-lactamase superfamily II)